MANLAFDATQVDPTNTFDPLPVGDYLCMIVESDIKPTKSGTGHYAQFTLQVIDGQYEGRKIWDRINIHNTNATAQEIGQRQLSALCHAVGVLQVQDTAELHDKPFIAQLVIKSDPQYGPQNEVKGYKAAGGQAPRPAPAPAPAAPAAAPAAAAGSTPPWMRK